jgi:hypothetical protein
LVSEEGGAKFELTAKADADLGSVDLADLNAGFKLSASYNSAFDMVSRSNLTPLFKAMHVNWIGQTGYKSREALQYAATSDRAGAVLSRDLAKMDLKEAPPGQLL